MSRMFVYIGLSGTLMMQLTISNDEGVGRIRTGPIVVLGDPIDFLALVFPAWKELALKDVTDSVVHHMQVIENVCELRILFRKLLAQLACHRHKDPFNC